MLSKTTTSIYLSLTHQEQMTITKKFLISKKYYKNQDLRKQFKSEFVKMPYAAVTLFVLINDKIENLNESIPYIKEAWTNATEVSLKAFTNSNKTFVNLTKSNFLNQILNYPEALKTILA